MWGRPAVSAGSRKGSKVLLRGAASTVSLWLLPRQQLAECRLHVGHFASAMARRFVESDRRRWVGERGGVDKDSVCEHELSAPEGVSRLIVQPCRVAGRRARRRRGLHPVDRQLRRLRRSLQRLEGEWMRVGAGREGVQKARTRQGG